MKKRISFIITYHNEPLPLLDECIQSVLNLPLAPEEREILLIDDGSAVPAPEGQAFAYSVSIYIEGKRRALGSDVRIPEVDYPVRVAF